MIFFRREEFNASQAINSSHASERASDWDGAEEREKDREEIT